MNPPTLTFRQLVAIERALAAHIVTLDALDGNLVDPNLTADAQDAAEVVQSLRVASGMGLSPTVAIEATS